MAGQFSCDSCGKTYAWKPALSGKRVKCKCGAAMTVPASDPAADDAGLDDLAALAQGGGMDEGGAAASGPQCPGCGEVVDPAAVICINCGTNLKTGQKLKTATVAAAAVGGGSKAAPKYDRAFGVKSVGDENQMSPQARKILAIAIAAVLVIGLTTLVVFVTKKTRESNEREAALAKANPPKLERLIDAVEKHGSLTEAMRSGDLGRGGAPPPQQPRIRYTKDGLNGMASSIGRTGATGEAREWLNQSEINKLNGMTHIESVNLVKLLYDTYKCRFVQVMLEKESDTTSKTMVITVPDYDKAVGGTADGPVREEFFLFAKAFMKKQGDDDPPPDLGQSYTVFQLDLDERAPVGRVFGGAGAGADADEDDEDADDAGDKPAATEPDAAKPAAPKPDA